MANRKFRKGLSLLLSGTMLVSMLQMTALAAAPDPICGIPAHVHNEACYVMVGAHTHEDGCYTVTGAHIHDETCESILDAHAHDEHWVSSVGAHTHDETCESILDAHTHGDDCYSLTEGHAHGDECYTVTEGHTHDDDCYTVVPGHSHEDNCYDESGAQVCTASTEDVSELTCTQEEGEDASELTCTLEEREETSELICTLAENEGSVSYVCGLEESEGTIVYICGLEESEGAVGYICGQEESEGLREQVCELEESAGRRQLVCQEQVHAHEKTCYPVELSRNAKRLLEKQTTAQARVYLLYENEIPGNINQSFDINKFGPQGDNTPYFIADVNLEELLADGTVDVYWTNKDQWYISVQSGTTGQRYTAESLWEKIIDCMSAEDQAKFDEFFHGMYIGYVLKDEAGRGGSEPHIDGVMVEEPPVYFTELKINGDVVGTFLESGSGTGYNNADGTHYDDEILPKFEEELQELYEDITIDWESGTFTDGRYIWEFSLTGNAVAENGYPNYTEITRNIYYVSAYSLTVSRPIEVPAPSLDVTKVVDRTEARIGDTLSYTITVANNGNAAAESVVVTDVLDARLSFVEASEDGFDVESGLWTVGELAAGQSKELTITVTINDTAAVNDQISNLAVINDEDEDEAITTVLPRDYTLTVNWVNQKGEALAEALTETKQEGSSYTTEQKEIDGYQFLALVEDSAPVSGTMDEDKVVTYVYYESSGSPARPREPAPSKEPEPSPSEEPEVPPVVSGSEPDPTDDPEPDPELPPVIEESEAEPVDEGEPVEIEEPEVPLADLPATENLEELVELEEEGVPLAAPIVIQELEEPEEAEVPLADVPVTGDPVMMYAAVAALSGVGLVVLNKKGKEEEA